MSHPVLLTCGHAANSTDYQQRPACSICGDIKVAAAQPNLIGRLARCQYGDRSVASSYELPFFKYRVDRDMDEYYCGCYGWN